MKRITLYADRQGSKGPIIGFCVEYRDGWRFMPNMCSRKPSKKSHATWEKCIPRWTGHPNATQSDLAEQA